MKDIKKIATALVGFLLLINCSEKEFDTQKNYDFVHFGLLVDANNRILTFPQVNASIPETDAYTHISTKTIKVPVIISSFLSNAPTEVFYSVTTEGTFSDYQILPIQKVSIPAGKLVDTLRISFNSRWQVANINKIKLKITSTSNPNLRLGFDNATRKMDNLTITLGDLSKIKYNFSQNSYIIQGNVNEELLIPINFSQEISNQLIGNFNFINAQFVPVSACDGSSGSFQYTLIRQPIIDGASQIFYKLKVLSTSPSAANLKLTLNTGLTDFEIFGISITNINKNVNLFRQGDPAAFWYNTADALNRTYCRPWYYDPATMACRYGNLAQMFTKPVSVPIGSAFDNGFGYHKFKIGFVGNTPPIGTNPFDFQRFYGGASNASPAFTILEALEFFPENGTSLTNGIVKVVPQTLTFVKLSNNQNINVPICGSGAYYFNSTTNRFEMYIDINCDETAINGNSNVVRSMYIYRNNAASATPANLPIACSNRITL